MQNVPYHMLGQGPKSQLSFILVFVAGHSFFPYKVLLNTEDAQTKKCLV